MKRTEQTPASIIRFYVNSNDELCTPLIHHLSTWLAKKDPAEFTLNILPVLENPVDVVRYQLFYTPALVVDDKLIVMNILDVAQLDQALQAL